MLLTATTLLLLPITFAFPLSLSPQSNSLSKRQGCPRIHVFGARETTAPPGFGTAGSVINLILNANPGATAEAINYPACGGQDFCGGIDYATSARMGTAAVAAAVNAFNRKCPRTQLVLVGYSQGGQVTDNAFCGGGDLNIGLSDTSIPIRASARAMVRAVILMGSPRFVAGHPFNVGTCTAQGFAPRPAGFTCAGANIIQSYCDEPDPFCCKGNDQATHQGYGVQFGQQALQFVQRRLR